MTLSDRRFVVIGAGGVGGHLLDGLSKLLEFQAPGSTLVIVDGDNFEPKNLERQSFNQLGNKADVRAFELAQTLQNTVVIPMPMWVVSDEVGGAVVQKDDEDPDSKIAASQLLREDDVVFAVVDNFACRKTIFEAARAFGNIDVFTGGNDDRLFGSVTRYARRDGADILEHPSERHAEYDNPGDRNPGEMSCQERAEIEGGSQILATNMAVAAFLLGRVQKVLIAGEEDLEGEIYFDLGLGKAEAYDRRDVHETVQV